MRRAFSLARLNAGSSIEARIEMMAMTTSSSMRVNPCRSESEERCFIRVSLRSAAAPLAEIGDSQIRDADERIEHPAGAHYSINDPHQPRYSEHHRQEQVRATLLCCVIHVP